VLPQVTATRYVSPLREGGSLPGLVEADDLGTYVVKFRGAGQGRKALVAEVIVGELGRRIGVRVPELRAVQLDAAIGRYEADQEVQELLTASIGLNLGVDFLPGSFGFDGVANLPPADDAGRILWLDAFTANVDRTWRNPNLLVWHRNLWAIDHGAALWFQHSWATSSPERFAVQPFDITTHVLGAHATVAAQLDAELAALMTDDLLRDVLDAVPDDWLEAAPDRPDPAAVRTLYLEHLRARVDGPRPWLPAVAA
jgi:hypothetical protein